jgi:hypothetical protein
MSTDLVRQVLETYVQSNFPTLQPGVPLMFLNTRFDTPTVPWVHVAVLPGLIRRASIGRQSDFNMLGVVNVTCMVPENSSTRTARQLADSMWSVLADRQIPLAPIGHITTYDTKIHDRGVVSGWYTVNVIVSFRAKVELVR